MHRPAPDCLHSIRAGEALPVTHGVLPVQTGYGLTDHLTENKTWSQDYQNVFCVCSNLSHFIVYRCFAPLSFKASNQSEYWAGFGQYLPVRAHLRAETLEAGPQLLRLSLRGEILVTGNQF